MSLDEILKKHEDSITRRTWCKYGDCNLEKLESEFKELERIWTELEKNWDDPVDWEDLYRIYPLLDTTAALARKRIAVLELDYSKQYLSEYKVKIVEPSENREVKNKEEYYWSDEYELINGTRKEILFSKVVSTFLHAMSYRYVDTRKEKKQRNGFEIYLSIKTDKRFQFFSIKSYINTLEKFITDEIQSKMKRKSS